MKEALHKKVHKSMVKKENQHWLPGAGLQGLPEMTGKIHKGTFQGGDNLQYLSKGIGFTGVYIIEWSA